MKRQNSHLSSASRRDDSPESLRSKTIGCMSGIIHLLSKYQNRHKKSLTFGKNKQEKDIIVVSSPPEQIRVSASGCTSQASPPSQGQRKLRSEKGGKSKDEDLRRFSCDLPTRSPTLSAEIRRSNSVNSPASSGTSPALVARLMGLEAVPAAARSPPVETSREKRRKLVGALEKCDNDLKALKEMIVALRSAESHQSVEPIAGSFLTHEKVHLISGVKCKDNNCDEQRLSPVSVFNEFTRLRLNRNSCTSTRREKGEEIKRGQPSEIRTPAAIDDDFSAINVTTKSQSEEITRKQPLIRRRKGMMESLNEICSQISWGYSREMGRIGMVLQHHIYIDLIEEMINDVLGFSACFRIHDKPLPFEACRRRLRF